MTDSKTPIHRLTLALPAYNEAASIGELLDRAVKALDQLGLEDWEVIVVDDGSSDDTANLVVEASTRDERIRLVKHPENRGLGGAIVTCLWSSLERGEEAGHLIVTMDADLTHPPESIREMIEGAEAGSDLVIASRFQPGSRQHGVPPFRMLMSVGARILFNLFLGIPGVRDYTCGFRGMRATLTKRAFDRYGKDSLITRSGFACTDELLVKLAAMDPSIGEIPFILRYDLKRGVSKINLGVTIMETLKLLASHRRELRQLRRESK